MRSVKDVLFSLDQKVIDGRCRDITAKALRIYIDDEVTGNCYDARSHEDLIRCHNMVEAGLMAFIPENGFPNRFYATPAAAAWHGHEMPQNMVDHLQSEEMFPPPAGSLESRWREYLKASHLAGVAPFRTLWCFVNVVERNAPERPSPVYGPSARLSLS